MKTDFLNLKSLALLLIACHAVFVALAQHNDSTSMATVTGKIQVANAGFAPVPAFSFDDPIAVANLSIKKKRFSYNPDFSLGLNGKPWMASNWFRYVFFENKKAKSNIGLNPSLFFKPTRNDAGEEVIHTMRNFTFEWVGERTFSDVLSVRLTFMQIHAFDNGALSGSYFDISVPVNVIRIPDKILIVVKPQLFCFNFTGNVDGVFSSFNISIEPQKIPLSVYMQAVVPLWADFPGTQFKCVTGLVYSF